MKRLKQFQPVSSLRLPMGLENPTIFIKMETFSLNSTLSASAECVKNVESKRTEGFQEVAS